MVTEIIDLFSVFTVTEILFTRLTHSLIDHLFRHMFWTGGHQSEALSAMTGDRFMHTDARGRTRATHLIIMFLKIGLIHSSFTQCRATWATALWNRHRGRSHPSIVIGNPNRHLRNSNDFHDI